MFKNKRRNKVPFVTMVSLLILSLIFAGCSTDPASGGDEQSEGKDSGAAQTDGETVTLTVWTLGKPHEKHRLENIKEAAKKLNEELEKEGKNTKVVIDGKHEDSSFDDYKQRFTLSFESKKGPDIILSGHEDIAPWSKAGYIIPLDQYIDKYEQFNDVYDFLWDSVKFKGERWAIPQDVEARPIYYQKEYLKQLGWSDEEIEKLPKKIEDGEFTLYDLLEIAKEAQDKGLVKEGHGFFHRPVQGGDFYMFYYAFGGEMFDAEQGKLVLDKEALLKYYQFFHDSVFKYKTTPESFIGMEWDIWHKTVTSKEAFISQAGTWTVAEWLEQHNLSEDDWKKMGYALVPAGEKGKSPVTLSHPLVYMITSQSKHPDLAARVLALATTPELNTRHAVESNHLAILKSQEDDPDYTNNEFLSDVTYMLEYTKYLPNHEQFGTYDEVVFRGLSAVEAGQMTPEEGVEVVVKDLERQLGDEVIIK